MKPASRRWTSDEKAELDRLLDAGKEVAEIAVSINRTRQAIYARLQRLYRKRVKSPARLSNWGEGEGEIARYPGCNIRIG
jgi:IS30 family transposase